MNTPKIEFLGWDEPAIELVAEKLLAGLRNPQKAAQYRRATVVVPTEGSGRRLREYMAEKAGHSWYKALKLENINLGTSRFMITPIGKYINKYNMTISKELAEYE